VLVLIPALMLVMMVIHRHYRGVRDALTLDDAPTFQPVRPPRVVVPVSRLDRTAARAVAFARSLSGNVTAVHVSETTGEAQDFWRQWEAWDTGIPLVIVESPYRSLLPPLLGYIDALASSDPNEPIAVVVAEFVPRHFWQNFLHNQAALRLKMHLLSRPNTVVINVPSHVAEIERLAPRDAAPPLAKASK